LEFHKRYMMKRYKNQKGSYYYMQDML